MESYGYVETRGLVTAIEAADTALKTSNVRLTNLYHVKGGIVTIEVTGDVAAVTAAVEAAAENARKLGNYLNSTVIARVDDETKKILVNRKKTKRNEEKEAAEEKEEKNFEETADLTEENSETEQTEVEEKEEIETEKTEETEETEKISDTENEKAKKMKRQYQDMKVIDLKIRVNNLKSDYTWNQIKGMTKKKLIEILMKND